MHDINLQILDEIIFYINYVSSYNLRKKKKTILIPNTGTHLHITYMIARFDFIYIKKTIIIVIVIIFLLK